MSAGEFWPEKGVQRNDWTLNYRDSAPTSLSGGSVAVPLGEAYWSIDVSVEVPARSSLVAEWLAFFGRRRGKRNTFTANRSFHSFPAARDVTSDVGLAIQEVDRAADALRIGLAAGNIQRPTPGDMIGYYTAAQGYYIGKVLGVIDQAPTTVQLEMAPPPFPAHGALANPRRIKAIGEFRLDGQPRINETSSRRTWDFRATQVIRG